MENMTDNCIFCRLDDGELNQIIAENHTFYARLDNFPAAPGHVEIVPKKHIVSFFSLTTEEMVDAFSLIKYVEKRLTGEYSPEGYTIGINEGKAAGRTIDHLHIHLIPRWLGDVPDPRGGIRRVVPNFNPELWPSQIALNSKKE